ncbi:MAG: quinolinate synthase NadA, partial [Chloroflexi bacterium]|nr:quinolinate synthase NadA [Chloroflexota bacterium]
TETMPLIQEGAFRMWQRDIPDAYVNLSGPELIERIAAARRKLGASTIVLGHHYQREDVVQFADFKGDSFKLSQWAAERGDVENIVFCGVHFMAESADILSQPNQRVILPNMAAGCSMADMADPDDVLDCWAQLQSVGLAGRTVPVTYMNSAAALKAFCGQNGGIVCTSTNAAGVLTWAMERGEKVLFFPDQHLGRNTGVKLGIALEDMVLWDWRKPLGGNTVERLAKAKLILWQGHCSVHMRFTAKQIADARAKYPGVQVVVHPECALETVQAADCNGSTEYIVKVVRESAPGSIWAVGTEVNLVSRIAHENPDKTVFCLDPVVCPCSTMYRIHPAYLAWVLDELAEGRVRNQVIVPPETAKWAKVALERMLAIV